MNMTRTTDWRKEAPLRRLRSIWKGIAYRLEGARNGGGHATNHQAVLDPMAVEDECWRELRKASKTWTLTVELPTSCVVHVSKADWDAYWGVQPAEKGFHLGRELTERAVRSGADAGFTLSVRVIPDATVSPGDVVVTTAFSDMGHQDDGRVPHRAVEDTMPSDKLPATEKLDRGDSRPVEGPANDNEQKTAGGIPQTEKSPLGKLPCVLATRDGNVLFGKDGDTIGTDRDPRDLPQLAFDHVSYPHVHREHARLANKSGQWSITNLGYNGAQVMQGGGALKALGINEGCTLSDGDMIVLAGELVLEFHQSVGVPR